MATLKINRGTTYTIGVAYQRNGVAATLVGATVRFTAKTAWGTANGKRLDYLRMKYRV